MATYQSLQVANKMPIQSHGLASSVYCDRFVIQTTASLTTADILQFGYAPQFARIVDSWLKATDLDTNGSPTIALNVGDAGDVDRFFAASNVGQAGTIARMTALTGFGYKYSSKTLITGAPSTNAATGVAGTIELALFYVIEDDGVGYPSV